MSKVIRDAKRCMRLREILNEDLFFQPSLRDIEMLYRDEGKDELAEAVREFGKVRSAYRFLTRYVPDDRKAEFFFRHHLSYHLQSAKDHVFAARAVWINSELIYPYECSWADYICEHSCQIRSSWTTAAGRLVLSGLPDKVTIWRGYREPYGDDGMSWSLSREIACSIPLMSGRGAGQPMLIKAETEKKYILAYLDQRQEQEVVVYHFAIHELGRETILAKSGNDLVSSPVGGMRLSQTSAFWAP